MTHVAYLEITTRNGLGRRTVELRERPLRIGRAGTNDVVLKDTRVSRHHAVIEVVNGRPLVRDLGSSRGIKINNRRREESDLRPGDRVRIGPFTIVLRDEKAAGRSSMPNGTSMRHNGYAASDESDSDATAGAIDEGLELAGESSADSQADSADESDAVPAVSPEVAKQLDALLQQVERLETAARKREQAFESLRSEFKALQERTSAMQAQAADASSDEQGRVDINAVRGAIEAEHAAVTSSLNQQRRELVDMLEQRNRQITQQIEQQASEVQARIEQLESAASEVSAGDRLEISEQRITDSADRLDQLATNYEQLAFEHSQVAGAVQELAARLAEHEEQTEAVKAVVDRVTVLEETAQQNTMNARQAMEHATQIQQKLEQVREVATAAETQATDVAVNQAEAAAQIAAHSDTIHHGSQQVVRIAKLVEDISQTQRAGIEERTQLKASVESFSARLEQLHESMLELEARVSSGASQASEEMVQANVAASKAHQKELASLRETVDSIGATLLLRVERLEAATAEASPQIDAVKDEIKRLAASSQRIASPAAVASVAPAVAPKKGKAAAQQQELATTAAPRQRPKPGAIPPSMDAEKSRQVMSQIFAPKDEQDERYKPVRDNSSIAIVIFVIVFGIGAIVAFLGPTLFKMMTG